MIFIVPQRIGLRRESTYTHTLKHKHTCTYLPQTLVMHTITHTHACHVCDGENCRYKQSSNYRVCKCVCTEVLVRIVRTISTSCVCMFSTMTCVLFAIYIYKTVIPDSTLAHVYTHNPFTHILQTTAEYILTHMFTTSYITLIIF